MIFRCRSCEGWPNVLSVLGQMLPEANSLIRLAQHVGVQNLRTERPQTILLHPSKF